MPSACKSGNKIGPQLERQPTPFVAAMTASKAAITATRVGVTNATCLTNRCTHTGRMAEQDGGVTEMAAYNRDDFTTISRKASL